MALQQSNSFSNSSSSSAYLSFDSNPFRRLLHGLNRGSRHAETELVRRFTSPLVTYIRRRMDRRFVHKFNAEDVVQSTFLSFLKRHRKAPYHFEDQRSLWSLLCTIAVRTLQRHTSRLTSQKRNLYLEIPQPQRTEDSSTYFWQATSRETDPSFQARTTELIPILCSCLDAVEQKILNLRFGGATNCEIALTVNRSTRSVYRTLQKIRLHLKRLIKIRDSGSLDNLRPRQSRR